MDISPSAVLFMTLLVGLSTYAYIYKAPTEAFSDLSKQHSDPQAQQQQQQIKLNIPKQPAPTAVANAPFKPKPNTDAILPGAPFGSIANSSPLPYKDPVQEKATLFQINSLLEDLRGFLGFEAKQLEDRSDPAIQLPLSKAKGDFQRLKEEFAVLTANPGIQSQLTQKDLFDMRSGLTYLQREARKVNATEGFQDSALATAADPVATREDLNETTVKIYAEIQRLSASGTTDPTVQARINALTSMRLDLQGILQKLDSGALQPADVPVKKSDIQKLLPLLPNVNQPLPTILKKVGLSPFLANVLPVKAGSKEAEYLAQNQEAINAALDKLVKGLSWSVALEYTSENKAQIQQKDTYLPNDKTLFETGVPSISEMNAVANPMGTNFAIQGMGSRGSRTYPITLEQQRADALSASQPANEAGGFDWKARAQQIRQAIERRGLNPADFGCLTPKQENSVSRDFSWRGYCKMICQRLQTTTDPGLPETCGCPPEAWLGWSK